MAKKEKLISRAQKYIQKGYYERAIEEYKTVVYLDPSDTSIRLRLGELYVKTGRKEDAIKEYSSVAKINAQKGFYLKAIAVYKQILKLDEANLDVRNKLADLYTRQRLVADAISEYSYIINVFEKKGRTSEAFELLKKMVEIDPENVGLRLKLADMQKKLGYEDDALTEYLWIFRKLMAQGKLDKAERILRDLYDAYPGESSVLEGLVELNRTKGDDAQYLSCARELLDIYTANGDLARAAGLCESILEVAPGDEKARAVLERLRDAKGTEAPEQGSAAGGEEEEGPAEEEPRTEEAPRQERTEEPAGRGPGGEEERLEGIGPEGLDEEPVIDFPEFEEPREDESLEEWAEEAVKADLESPEGAPPLQEEGPAAGMEDREEAMARAVPEDLVSGEEEEEELFEVPFDEEEEVEEEIEEIDIIEPVEVLPEPPVPGQRAEAGAEEDSEEEKRVGTISLEEKQGGEESAGDEDYVDLTQELGLEEAIDRLVGSWTEGEEGESVEEFKAGMGEQLSREDMETHYNLGIAYMEMELYEDALREFKLSANDPVYGFEAQTRLGLCSMAVGAVDDAINHYLKALRIKGRSQEERKGIMYELGLAYEAAGKDREALEMFRAVEELDSGYRGVSEKIRELTEERSPIPRDDDLIEVELL